MVAVDVSDNLSINIFIVNCVVSYLVDAHQIFIFCIIEVFLDEDSLEIIVIILQGVTEKAVVS